MFTPPRRLAAAATAFALLASPAPAAADTTASTSTSAVLTTLDTIPVKGRAPKTGYSRSQFGEAWSDDVSVEFGHNGCRTRDDILRRDLVDITFKPNTRDCVVAAGILNDPLRLGDLC